MAKKLSTLVHTARCGKINADGDFSGLRFMSRREMKDACKTMLQTFSRLSTRLVNMTFIAPTFRGAL